MQRATLRCVWTVWGSVVREVWEVQYCISKTACILMPNAEGFLLMLIPEFHRGDGFAQLAPEAT